MTPEEELQKCQAERDEYLNGWKRAQADFANYQKEESKRLEAAGKILTSGLMVELINVLDSFETAKDLPEGALLIKSQLEDLLKKFGLERIRAEAGQKFDPAFHEAVLSEQTDQPAETIIEEMQKGYALNGRVIRASKVKITK